MAQTQLTLRQFAPMRFEARGDAAGGHIIIGAAKAAGGRGDDLRPMQTLLAALASCSSIDIISILRKSKQAFSNFNVVITGTRTESIPQVFTRIQLTFQLTQTNTPLDEGKVRRAIELSLNKYCSVAAMLRAAGVALSYQLELS